MAARWASYCYASSFLHVADKPLTIRRHFLFLTMTSRSGSTPSFRKPARCAEASTIPISMSSKRTASPLCGSGPSAVSFKIVPMFYRAINSSLDNSRTRLTEPIITESASSARRLSDQIRAKQKSGLSYYALSPTLLYGVVEITCAD